MGEPAKNLRKDLRSPPSASADINKDSCELVNQTSTDEIVIAFCGLIGAPIKEVTEEFSKQIKHREYEVIPIKISSILEVISGTTEVLKFESPVKKKEHYISLGNQIREDQKDSGILAAYAISRIHNSRLETKESSGKDEKRICYLIDSLKTPDELELLKAVYSNSFYLVGVYAPKELRIANLTNGAAKLRESAEDLIDEDYFQENRWGQKVKKVFYNSDFFYQTDNNSIPGEEIARFCNLIFASDIISPTVHERSMFSAWEAGANSACLSRQVGASVVTEDGIVIGQGWNDVPRFRGGVYAPEDGKNDKRCYIYKEYCRNSKTIEQTIEKIADDIFQALPDSVPSIEKNKIVEILNKSDFSNATEYSRAIHAEMCAVFNAMKSDPIKIKNSSLYVTTYPCHNCARHIVLSGIKEIYFIEPYPKSKAVELHPDSLTEDVSETSKVRLIPFSGVAPNRYLDLFSFSNGKRKDKEHNKIKPSKHVNGPRTKINLESVPNLEKVAIAKINETGKKYEQAYQNHPTD